MKPSDPLLLADVTLSCRIYPAGKVDISQHLAIPRFPQSDDTVSKQSADLFLCVVKHSRPPDLKSSSNVSFPFAYNRARNRPQLYDVKYVVTNFLRCKNCFSMCDSVQSTPYSSVEQSQDMTRSYIQYIHTQIGNVSLPLE